MPGMWDGADDGLMMSDSVARDNEASYRLCNADSGTAKAVGCCSHGGKLSILPVVVLEYD